jgi:soluble lytic murein transglycosylase-like protein
MKVRNLELAFNPEDADDLARLATAEAAFQRALREDAARRAKARGGASADGRFPVHGGNASADAGDGVAELRDVCARVRQFVDSAYGPGTAQALGLARDDFSACRAALCDLAEAASCARREAAQAFEARVTRFSPERAAGQTGPENAPRQTEGTPFRADCAPRQTEGTPFRADCAPLMQQAVPSHAADVAPQAAHFAAEAAPELSRVYRTARRAKAPKAAHHG